MRVIITIVFAVCSLFSQSKIVDLSNNVYNNSFHADKIKVSNTGYYLLDSGNRQIMFIDNNKESILAGGYGIGGESFIDPIEIMVSKLKVYVIDGTENNIIKYDHKLNYLTTIQFEEIYPSFCGIDDWGNVYLYSETEDKVFKLIEGESIINDFIDLAIYDINEKTIKDFNVWENGEIAILTDQSLTIFNRLGNIQKELPLNRNINFVFKHLNNWLGIDEDNNIINLKYNDPIQSLIDEEIVDIDYFSNRLYILLENQIRIVDVELE